MNVLDSATLETLRGLQEEGEDDLLSELIDLFLQDAPTRVAHLRQAIECEDWPAVASWAHSLRGSCGSLGALRMAEVCARLERHGRDSASRPTAEAIYRELEGDFALVCAELRRERNGTH